MIAPQPFFRARGTPFSVLHRVRALLTRGFKIDLVTYPFGEDIQLAGLNIVRAPRPFFVRDVKIGPSFAKLALDIPLYRTTVKMLRENEYDFIHSHEEAAFFAVNLAKKYDLPHIYDMHSSLPQQLSNFESFNRKPIRRAFEYLENRVLSTCQGVITICDDLARIAESVCPKTPHSMIENTADDTMVFGRATKDVRTDLGLSDKKIALYTGTFELYQGLDLLIDAFKLVVQEFPAAHLVLVGGNPDQVSDCQLDIESRGLAQNVTLTGTVHPSEIPSYVSAADLIVSPRSSGTNTPLKIYGYMRSGKPIVATDRLTHTQILNDQMAELVPATPEGLAKGMNRVLADDVRASAVGEEARRYAEKEFSDDSYIAKVNDLYREVIRKLSQSNAKPQGAGREIGESG